MRRLLIFGGVYGNREALSALLSVAEAEGIGAEDIVITGDLVAYCADGAAVADMCRRRLARALIIRGNCERALAENDNDCGCGFAEGSKCSVLSVAWYRHAAATIDDDTKAWFGGLPATAEFMFGGRRFIVIHGASDADNTFIFASTPAAEKLRHFNALAGDKPAANDAPPAAGIVAGHCGIPFTQRLNNGGVWHNSGALGMPANDGTPRVWYSLWRELPNGEIEIRHRALTYDCAPTAAAMQAAGLPPDYRETLSTGVWPSDSVLPPEERAAQGVALAESVIRI